MLEELEKLREYINNFKQHKLESAALADGARHRFLEALSDLIRLDGRLPFAATCDGCSASAAISVIAMSLAMAESDLRHAIGALDVEVACDEILGLASAIIPFDNVRDRKENPLVRKRVFELTGGLCVYCDARLGDDWHIDHVVPSISGGPDHVANYVPSCGACNMSKSTSHVIEFIARRRRPLAEAAE